MIDKETRKDMAHIVVRIKNVYGNELVYPVCNKARSFVNIARTKTLLPDTITEVKALGFTIIVETPKL